LNGADPHDVHHANRLGLLLGAVEIAKASPEKDEPTP